MTGAKIVNWIVERIGNSIDATIVKLIDRWIAVKIGNRIELWGWTARIGQTDLIDQIG